MPLTRDVLAEQDREAEHRARMAALRAGLGIPTPTVVPPEEPLPAEPEPVDPAPSIIRP